MEKIALTKKKEENPNLDDKTTGKKLFYFKYRGQDTVKTVNELIKCGAPITPIYTTRKLKTNFPSLKPKVEKNLTS